MNQFGRTVNGESLIPGLFRSGTRLAKCSWIPAKTRGRSHLLPFVLRSVSPGLNVIAAVLKVSQVISVRCSTHT